MKPTKKSVAYENIDFIKLLTSYGSNPKQFKKVVKNCTNKELTAISEIILNFLKGHLKCDIPKN